MTTSLRTRLGLESLDRRDVPSAVLGDHNAPQNTTIRWEPPGCWPGPPPMVHVSLTAGITPAAAGAQLGAPVGR